MGLLLSILVVCVGVLEAVSCFRHIQDGYLPFWMPRSAARCPAIDERRRRAPSGDSSSSSEEISRIFLNDAMSPNSSRLDANYGLTPILAEHRRNTPILRVEEDDAEGEEGTQAKYVENNIDECCCQTLQTRSDSNQSPPIIERFRPISPPDLEQDGANAVGSASEQFVAVPETSERSVSEETLCDLESDVAYVEPEVEPPVCALGATGGASSALGSLETTVDTPVAGTVSVENEEPAKVQESNDMKPPTESSSDENDQLIPVPEPTLIPQNHDETPGQPSDTIPGDPEDLELQALVETLQHNIKTLPTKPLVEPFVAIPHPDFPPLGDAPLSRPGTPSTPRKVKADISWPIFHPDEPVIKRPTSEFGKVLRLSLSRDDSIDEDLLVDDDDLELRDIEDHVEGTCVQDNLEDATVLPEIQSKPDLDTFLDILEGSLDTADIADNNERINVQGRQAHNLIGASVVSDTQAKLDADMFLESLKMSDGENYGESVEGPYSQTDSELDANASGLDGKSRPDLDLFLDGLETSFEPLTMSSPVSVIPHATQDIPAANASLPAHVDNTLTQQDTDKVARALTPPFQLDSTPESTSHDISNKLPEIPSHVISETSDPFRAPSPTVKAMEEDVCVVDDYFSRTVISEPIEISTPFVDLQAIPPARSTPSVGRYEETSRPGKVVVDQYGRILGVESEEELLKRLEAMIEKVDVKEKDAERQEVKNVMNEKGSGNGADVEKQDARLVVAEKDADKQETNAVDQEDQVERQFDKTFASDTQRMVSLKDIIEPPCQKVTTYCVADVKAVSGSDRGLKETDLKPAEAGKDVDLSAVGFVDCAQLAKEVEPTGSGNDATNVDNSVDPEAKAVQSTKTEESVTGIVKDKSADLVKEVDSIQVVDEVTLDETGKDVEPIVETKANLEQQTNENASEFETPKDPACPAEDISVPRLPSNISIEIDRVKDDDEERDADSSESLSLCKDITSKESSIKRRKSYKDKKRNSASPRSSTETIPEDIQARDRKKAAEERKAFAKKDSEEVVKEDDVEPTTSPDHQQEQTPAEVVPQTPESPRNDDDEPPPDVVRRRESATEAILNKELLPVEVLHSGETSKESAVFATSSHEQRKRLKKPVRAESFEEAPLEVKIQGRLTTPLESGDKKMGDVKVEASSTVPLESRDDGESKDTGETSGAAGSDDVGRKCTDPASMVAPRGGIETNPSVDERSVGEDDVDGESASTTSDVKRPTQSSNPAFWLIFSGEYTKAMSKDWHSGHFCCWQCDESLTGQRYVLRDDHPYCIKCYESVFANMCEECSKTIGIDSKDLSYKDKHWHEACFLCNKCRVSLVDKQFGSKADKIYCGNCYDSQFASRCDGCGEIFRAGTKKMEYKTRQWHEKCFCCCVCKSAIGTKSFIPREQEIYCATCYEEKFATRCVKCNKIITSGGVTYKNEPWHRECFTCTHCSASLAGQRFTSRDEKPYCAECFGELFAKRCTACVKPITGIGGTRFISFEDRHWHNDCFICAACKASLVGRGFITDADDIICPECAKQKLM